MQQSSNRRACFVVAWLMLSTALVNSAAADRLKAVVLEQRDQFTRLDGAAVALERAGFSVVIQSFGEAVDTDTDLIMIGTFASESGEYKAWVQRNESAMRRFISGGGTLLQMTQADQTEEIPPFLPVHLEAVRDDLDSHPVLVLEADHALTRRLPMREIEAMPPQLILPRHANRTGSWETFNRQKGFRVLLALAESARPVLMVGQLGRGRIILTSLYFDKIRNAEDEITAPEAFMAATDGFYTGLYAYVAAVRAGRAADIEPTPEFVPPAPFEFVPGSMTIAVIPDTQLYSERFPHHFYTMTDWIVANREEHNIKAVLHVGDIVNRNTVVEWERAQDALERLHGHVAVALAPGNHDYGNGGRADVRTTLMSDYITYEKWATNPGFGGVFEEGRMENHYSTFEHNGVKYVAIALEWSPRDAVLEWASGVLEEHADHVGMVTLHAYMYSDNTRYDWKTRGREQNWNPYAYGTANDPGGVNDGEDIWQKLVRKHPNMAFVFSGHVLHSGVGKLSSEGDHGNTVHQLLGNHQMRREGGDGWFRLVQILPDNKTVRVTTYSSTHDQWNTEPGHQFELQMDARPAAPAR